MGVENDESVKFYLRLPIKIVEEQQIKDLHPDITSVYLPRQKSRRWCFIYFKNGKTSIKAVEALRKVKVDGQRIRVLSARKEEPEIKAERRQRKQVKKLNRKLAKNNTEIKQEVKIEED